MQTDQLQNLSELGDVNTLNSSCIDDGHSKQQDKYQFYSKVYKLSMVSFSIVSLICGSIVILANSEYLQQNMTILLVLITYSCIELNCLMMSILIFAMLYLLAKIVKRKQPNYLLGICFIIFQIMTSSLYLCLIPVTFHLLDKNQIPAEIKVFMIFQCIFIVYILAVQFMLVINNQFKNLHIVLSEKQQGNQIDHELVEQVKQEIEGIKSQTGNKFF